MDKESEKQINEARAREKIAVEQRKLLEKKIIGGAGSPGSRKISKGGQLTRDQYLNLKPEEREQYDKKAVGL